MNEYTEKEKEKDFEYFKSIKADVTIEQFKDGITIATEKAYDKNNGSDVGVDTELHFIDEEIAKEEKAYREKMSD